MNPKFEYIKEASPFGSLRQIPEIPKPKRPEGYRMDMSEAAEYYEKKMRYEKYLSEIPLYPLSVQPSEEWMQRKEYEEGVDFTFHNRYTKTPSGNWISGIGPVAFPIEKKGDDLSLTSTNNNSIE